MCIIAVMANKIAYKQLRELGRIFSGAPIYSIAKLSDGENGIPLLNIKDIVSGTVATQNLSYVSADNFKNAEHYLVRPGDVLVACRGTQLKAGVVPEGIGKALITANLIGIRLIEEILPEFLAAYFQTEDGQKELLAHATSTTQLVLNVADAEKIMVPVPPRAMQEKIAGLINMADQQYRLNMEMANLNRKIAHQVLIDMLNK